jgi:hypothetical protein
MKISAKKIQEKTKLHLEKKALINKKLAEEAARQKTLAAAHKKIIKDVVDQCLNAAIEGRKLIRLGFKPEDQNIELVELLKPDSFAFDIEVLDAEFTLLESLRNHLKSLPPKEVTELKLSIRKKAIQLYDTFINLNNDPELNYAEEYLAAAIHAEVGFEEQISALQDAYNFFDFHYTVIAVELLDEIETHFNSLREMLIGSDFFTINTYDATNLEISWEEFSRDDCINSGLVDDFLNPVGLGWISSNRGQLFISSLENLIDDLIEDGKTETIIKLTNFDTKFEITLQNQAKIFTILDETGLLKFFKKLGYKSSVKAADVDDTFYLRISWGDS